MSLSEVQRRWQATALEVLLVESGKHEQLGLWVPAWLVTEGIRGKLGCTAQAATGALRALLTVGLADRAETTREGLFWKPTEAAERMYDLVLAPLAAELHSINERLEETDEKLDHILWMQEMRERLER